MHDHKGVARSGLLAPDTSKKNINEPKKAPVQKQEIVSFTWACDILTVSLKTVQVTASLQVGVVREPWYRKYLVMLVGRRSIRLKAEKVVSLSVDRKTNCDLKHNQTTCKIYEIQYQYFCQKKKTAIPCNWKDKDGLSNSTNG